MAFNADVCALTAGQPELVLLDLDGTLIDSVPDLAAATDAMLRGLGRTEAGREKVSHWIGNGADMLVRRALADGDEPTALALTQNHVASARALFDQAYLESLHHATGAFPGVDEFLCGVTAVKILITNKPRMFTEPLIRSFGWEEHFAFIVCGDDLAEKKPSPLPLLHACERAGYAPQSALMIGDSKHDIQAAKAAGISTVAVTYGYNHGEDIRDSAPDILCSELTALIA
ncbi:MAG: phosphoglycolate phosphatase [Thalassolituus sp.]